MTTTSSTSALLFDSTDSLLRFALRADATVCAAAGLLVAMAADPLSRLSGLSATVEWILGALLVAYGALLYVCAAVPTIRRVGVAVVIANLGFSVLTVVTLVGGWLPLTPAGAVLTAGFAALTLALAHLQYLGLRRLA